MMEARERQAGYRRAARSSRIFTGTGGISGLRSIDPHPGQDTSVA